MNKNKLLHRDFEMLKQNYENTIEENSLNLKNV
jgi:hypothetical protein